MKKVITLLIVGIFLVPLTGCSANTTRNDEKGKENISGNENVDYKNDIVIKIGDKELEGVLLDTELANEIKKHFPLSVQMVKYGNREYYGGIDFTPNTNNISSGKKSFEDGDITYCSANNTLAIFYNKKEMPNLTMEVIKIGKVTSNLSIFETFNSSETITFDFKDN